MTLSVLHARYASARASVLPIHLSNSPSSRTSFRKPRSGCPESRGKPDVCLWIPGSRPQVGFSRLGHSVAPISGEPEIGGAPRNDGSKPTLRTAELRPLRSLSLSLPPWGKEGAERRFGAMGGSTRGEARLPLAGLRLAALHSGDLRPRARAFRTCPKADPRSQLLAPGHWDRGSVYRGLPRYSACEAFPAGAAPCPTSLAPHEAPSVDQGE
jgi:hypothetical protein